MKVDETIYLDGRKMEGIMHISFAKIDFNCPHCQKKYSDEDDKYVTRCNSNKNGCTTIKCECGNRFGMTYDITGKAVGFSLEKRGRKAYKGLIQKEK